MTKLPEGRMSLSLDGPARTGVRSPGRSRQVATAPYLCAVLLSVCYSSERLLAGTNTPYPAGTEVSVTSTVGTVTGVLQDSNDPLWIALVESGRTQPTLIKATDLILRRVEPSSPTQPSAAAIDRPRVRDYFPETLREEMPDTEIRRDLEAIGGHYVYGQPLAADPERFQFTPDGFTQPVEGITVLVREAFTVGHYDKYRLPAWVAMRWTNDDLVRSEQVNFDRPSFSRDTDLPVYARGGTYLEFSRTGLERGHQARDADLEAWGMDAVGDGMLMSNIVPQQKGRNHSVWGKLENQHRFIVSDSEIDVVWIISGPVFDPDAEPEWVGNDGEEIAVPIATYKVIAWEDEEGDLTMRGYIIGRNDTDTNLRNYLVPVEQVELQTGLDFFPALDDAIEEILENQSHTHLWN